MTPDLSVLIENAGKAGIGGAILLALLGVSYVITAWRSGSASVTRQKDLQERMDDLEAELTKLKTEVSHLRNYGNSMLYQRNSARLVAERLALVHNETLVPWPADPSETPTGGTP